MRRNILFCFGLILFTFLNFVDSKICTERKWGYVTRTALKSVVYFETYMDNCSDLFKYDKARCLRTRLKRIIKPMTVSELTQKIVQKCCSGYIQDENSDSVSIKCKPICQIHCENGFCDQPNVCTCRDGYRKKNIWSGVVCDPICFDCTNGQCVSPYTCECNYGYISVNGTCEPVCSEPCENGNCIAPETCNCLPGFRKSNSSCTPYCSTGCENGECVAPETCHCNPGWIKVNNTLNVETCMPVCNEICTNKSCVPPDDCVCKPGYIKSGRNKCNFKCSRCVYGKCISREKCTCFPPWKLNEDETDCVRQIAFSSTTNFGDQLKETTLANVKTTDEDIIYPMYETETHVSNLSIFNWTNSTYMIHKDTSYNTEDASTEMQNTEDPNWLYTFLGIFLFLIVISVAILFIYKNEISRYFKGATYVVEDPPKYKVPETLVNVTFSGVKKGND